MPRIMLVGQEKGGVGKTLLVRALAEAVEGAPILEIDASHRMLEYGDRVSFFEMRASRETIEKTGGRAARSEFDGVLDAISKATLPTIVDIGANTSLSFFALLSDIAPELDVEFAVCVVVTNEFGALAETPKIFKMAEAWAKAGFLIENRLHGSVDAKWMKMVSKGAIITHFEAQSLEEGAEDYLQAGGLSIAAKLDPQKMRDKHGIGPAVRIRRDLQKFKLEAMAAVRPAAEWLVGGSDA